MKLQSLLFGFVVLAAGCAAEQAPSESSGNAALGIASFSIDDQADRTSVVGLDAAGNEIARLDLVHGQFALSDAFKDEYPGMPVVTGRKLDIAMNGEHRFVWETAGFSPTQHMPAFARSDADLAMFVQDPHVKPLLDSWLVGFESTSLDELAYTQVTHAGGSARTFYNQTGNYGNVIRDGTTTLSIGVCGGTTETAYQAILVDGFDATYPAEEEYKLGQACSNGTWSQKFCRFDSVGNRCTLNSANDGIASQCGCTLPSVACKGCGTNSMGSPAKYSMTTTASGSLHCYNETLNSLSITANSGGSVTTSIPGFSCTGTTCTTNTCAGAPITLTRTDTWFDFTGWSQTTSPFTECTGSANSCTVTLNGSQSVRANYGKLLGSITGVNYPSNGQLYTTDGITKNSSGTFYFSYPPGYTFTHSGVCTSFNNTGSTIFCGRTTTGTGWIYVRDTASGQTRSMSVGFYF